MKKTVSLLLTVSMLLCLCACGSGSAPADIEYLPIQTEAPSVSVPLPAEQLRLIEDNRSVWLVNREREPFYYAVTDLDLNGRLEIISASTQGTGIFTSGSIYQVNASGDGLDLCLETSDGNFLPEVIVTMCDAYTASDGTYYYIFTDTARSGGAECYEFKVALTLFHDTVRLITLASAHYTFSDTAAVSEYADLNGSPIDGETYASAAQRYFSGADRKSAVFGWFTADESQLSGLLEKSWEGFSLMAWSAPAVEEIPVPTVAPATQALPTPTPTPAPTAKPASDGGITITKNPTGEALAIGGKTWFIAHADKAASITWQMIDPSGRIYSLADAMSANPGLKLEALEGDTIAVSNVPQSLNGWSVQAVFSNAGGSAATSPAPIYVGDYVNAYASVINRYKQAFTAGSITPASAQAAGISEEAGYSAHVGYAMKDLDKDGTPELIIGGTGENNKAGNIIFEICTLENGQPKTLCRSHDRDRFYLRTDSTVLNRASGGAAYSYYTLYKFSKGSLDPVEYLYSDLDGNAVAVWYYINHTADKAERQISQNDAYAHIDRWEKAEYVPFFTKIV